MGKNDQFARESYREIFYRIPTSRPSPRSWSFEDFTRALEYGFLLIKKYIFTKKSRFPERQLFLKIESFLFCCASFSREISKSETVEKNWKAHFCFIWRCNAANCFFLKFYLLCNDYACLLLQSGRQNFNAIILF